MKNVDTIKKRETGFGDSFESSAGEGGDKLATPRGMRSEKGVVLIVVLVLSAVVLAVMTALIYMITSGTQISGLQKRYKTSLEAAKGGSDIFYQLIGLRGVTADDTTFTNALTNAQVASYLPILTSSCSGKDIYTGATYNGLQAKLMTPSSQWSNCNSSLTIDPKDSNSYDMKLTIGTAPAQYNYYVKIVATQEGNSGSTGGASLYTGSVITGTGGVGAIPVVSQPYLYAIEVDTENATNPAERAKLSILYQY